MDTYENIVKQMNEAREAMRVLEQKRQYARAAWLASGMKDRRKENIK